MWIDIVHDKLETLLETGLMSQAAIDWIVAEMDV